MIKREEAIVKASKLMACKVKMKSLKKELSELERDLRAYVEETSDKELGKVMAYEKASAPKLTGKTGKALELAVERLVDLLPNDYVQRKPALVEISAMLEEDKALKRILKKTGLNIERKTSVYFKHVS